jgi:hypothetical protein
MIGRRTIKGIPHNFIGTYTSRYSDYEGYWIFGLLTKDVEQLTIDLLNSETNNSGSKPLVFAVELAKRKFSEQITKNGFSISRLREAHLQIKKLPQPKSGFVNGRASVGNDFRFTAKVVSDYGKTYETEMLMFVAPHNPSVESQSTRALNP